MNLTDAHKSTTMIEAEPLLRVSPNGQKQGTRHGTQGDHDGVEALRCHFPHVVEFLTAERVSDQQDTGSAYWPLGEHLSEEQVICK